MNDLSQARIFGLLSETSQEVINEEMQNAYGEFVEQIRTVSNENDYSTTYRILVATRIEIASLETRSLYGQEKKCAYENILTKDTGYCQLRTRTVQSENSVSKSVPTPKKQLASFTTSPNR